MGDSIAIASLVIALASLAVAVWGHKRHDAADVRKRLGKIEQAAATVDFRIRDACHDRAKKTELDELRRELRGKIR